ncbi:hypothetical protein TNCV_1907621 [Trichonephila clavipes]|nr:hypothetical protein TNCV_1907621 [Trichonephila clavipes]
MTCQPRVLILAQQRNTVTKTKLKLTQSKLPHYASMRVLNHYRFDVHQPFYTVGLHWRFGLCSRHPGHEFRTETT